MLWEIKQTNCHFLFTFTVVIIASTLRHCPFFSYKIRKELLKICICFENVSILCEFLGPGFHSVQVLLLYNLEVRGPEFVGREKRQENAVDSCRGRGILCYHVCCRRRRSAPKCFHRAPGATARKRAAEGKKDTYSRGRKQKPYWSPGTRVCVGRCVSA